jgi:hypothetical protein
VKAAHAAADLGEELLAAFRLHPELPAGHHLFDGALNLNQVFSTHTILLLASEAGCPGPLL